MSKNKRNRTCHKYHYDMVKICRETDIVFTKCRVCGNLYPSTLEYFRKGKPNYERLIQPICRKCSCEREREYDVKVKEQKKIAKIEQQKPISKVEEHSLFEENEETIESKVDKILAFLGLNRGQYKK